MNPRTTPHTEPVDEELLARGRGNLERMTAEGTLTLPAATALAGAVLTENDPPADAKPPRRRRSDAGKPKPKPQPPAQTRGALTRDQWARINVLAGEREDAALANRNASERYNRAAAAFSDYLEFLTQQ